MRKRFRWTRETYRQAARLARISPIFHAYMRERDMPNLLARFEDLCNRYPQRDDPLAGEHWDRMRYLQYKHSDDGIPF